MVFDNASVNMGAGRLIQEKYPKVFVLGCDTHTYNLLIKDLCNPKNAPEINEVLIAADRIVNFVINHRAVRIAFEKHGQVWSAIRFDTAL